MRTLAADDSLSEETRESAQKVVDEIASAQIQQTRLKVDKESFVASLQKSSFEETREAWTEWLTSNRLAGHADTIVNATGSDAAPSDLRFLTDEDIADIGSAMTDVEKMRLQTALEALGEEAAPAAGTE